MHTLRESSLRDFAIRKIVAIHKIKAKHFVIVSPCISKAKHSKSNDFKKTSKINYSKANQ